MGTKVHQIQNKPFQGIPFLQELGGTFFLIFGTCFLCGLMEICKFPVNGRDLDKSNGGAGFYLAIIFGLTYIPVLWLLCFVFKKSSAHFNPAVTIAFGAHSNINFKRALLNILAQFIGAILAGVAVYVIAGLATPKSFGNQGIDPTTLGITSVKPTIYDNLNDEVWWNNDEFGSLEAIAGPLSQFIGFMVEFVGFGIFMLLILNAGGLSKKVAKKASSKQQQYLGTLFVGIGLAFFVFIEIPETGASLNPFRSLAPAIFQSGGDEREVAGTYMGIYLTAPVLAGVLATIINKRIHRNNVSLVF